MEPVRFAVVGIGGFAAAHHGRLKAEEERGRARVVAVAELALERFAEPAAALRQRGARLYGDALEMLATERGQVDIVTLPVGIALHAPLAIAAMEHGYDVLVEKPPAATIQDVDAMIAASARTGRFCAVGFQMLSSPLLRRLKSLIVSGRLGRLRELACYACWPRGDAYYARNAWAGRSRLGERWVLDGPMNNALAHQVMNLLFLAGPTRESAAAPVRVRAEIYRARDITGEDTTTFVADLPDGARAFFGVTHACATTIGPILRVVGDRATVEGPIQGPLTLTAADGASATLVAPPPDVSELEFANIIDYWRGDCPALNCPLAVARAMTLTLNGAYESSRRIHAIPTAVQRRAPLATKGKPDTVVVVDGLDTALTDAWRRLATLSDLGVPWAVKTAAFSLDGYRSFNGAELA